VTQVPNDAPADISIVKDISVASPTDQPSAGSVGVDKSVTIEVSNDALALASNETASIDKEITKTVAVRSALEREERHIGGRRRHRDYRETYFLLQW
jgi:hypothetical protein